MRTSPRKLFPATAASVLFHAALVGTLIAMAARAPVAATTPPSSAATEMPTAAAEAPVGESFEVPVDRDPDQAPNQAPPTQTAVPPAATAEAPVSTIIPAPALPSAKAPDSTAATAPAPIAIAPVSSAAPSARYGGVHERSAVDLAATFARAFPQAARGVLAQWAALPFGAAGEADVALVIDESGRLQGAPEIGGGPSPSLSATIKQVFWQIHGHVFTAGGARTALHVSAIVISKNVGAYAVGDGPFVSGVSSSFFELPPDRRVEIRVRMLP